MNSFTSHSKIEFIRQRRHGNASRFRFLTDSEDGYLITAVIDTHFLVNRQWDALVGARVERLVFDKKADFNINLLGGSIWGDLVNPDGTFKRYRLTADADPTALESRYRFLLTGAFDDKTPIVGVLAPDDLPSSDRLLKAINWSDIADIPTVSEQLRFTAFVPSQSDAQIEHLIGSERSMIPLIPDMTRTLNKGLLNWFDPDTSRIHVDQVQDTFRIRLSFTARPAMPEQLPTLISEIDISADGSGVFVAGDREPLTNVMNEEITLNFEGYARAGFVNNGGLLTIRSVNGDSFISNITILIKEA